MKATYLWQQGTEAWQKRLQLSETVGSFQATAVIYGLDPEVGEVRGTLAKVFVSPFGRRFEIPNTNEVRLIIKEGGRLRTYRVDSASRTAQVIEDTEAETAPQQGSSSVIARSTERHRGFWCVVEQSRDSLNHSGVVLVSEAWTWTISAGPAKGWTLRGVIKMLSSEKLVYYTVWDTLELEFKTLPRDLFVIPRGYRIIKAGSSR